MDPVITGQDPAATLLDTQVPGTRGTQARPPPPPTVSRPPTPAQTRPVITVRPRRLPQSPVWRRLGLTASPCWTRPANSQPSPSPRTTQAADRPPRAGILRAIRTALGLLTAPRLPAVWDHLRMTPPSALPTAGAACPLHLLSAPRDHKQKSRISRDSTRSMTTPTGSLGWTNCSTSWRSEELRSLNVRPFLKILSTFTNYTFTQRIEEAF